MLAFTIKSSRFLALFVLAAVLLTFSGSVLWAQIRTMRGEVKDEAGKGVKDVMVEIQRLDVSRVYKTKTDKGGKYVYTGLPGGTFRIVIRKEGFAPDFIDKIVLRLGDETSYDFVLRPGDIKAKLPFEYSSEDIEKIKEQNAKVKEQQAQSEEVKKLFQQGLDAITASKFPEAIDAFQQALTKDPDQPNIWANLADAQFKNNQADKAIESYQKAITIKPDDAGLYQNMGVIYGKMNKVAEADAAFQKAATLAAALNPQQAAVNFYNQGATYVNAGKSEEATAAFKKAVEADVNYAEAYYQLGLIYAGTGKPAECVQMMEKYVSLGKNPDNLSTAKLFIDEMNKQIKK